MAPQPREPCEEFHDSEFHCLSSPALSWWPTMADPLSELFVQLPHVLSPPAVEYRPCGSEPVRISCLLGFCARPLIISPFSVKAVSLPTLFDAE